MSKTAKKHNESNAAQELLDADVELRAAAELFASDENDEMTSQLRTAALSFAEAWNACEAVAR